MENLEINHLFLPFLRSLDMFGAMGFQAALGGVLLAVGGAAGARRDTGGPCRLAFRSRQAAAAARQPGIQAARQPDSQTARQPACQACMPGMLPGSQAAGQPGSQAGSRYSITKTILCPALLKVCLSFSVLLIASKDPLSGVLPIPFYVLPYKACMQWSNSSLSPDALTTTRVSTFPKMENTCMPRHTKKRQSSELIPTVHTHTHAHLHTYTHIRTYTHTHIHT